MTFSEKDLADLKDIHFYPEDDGIHLYSDKYSRGNDYRMVHYNEYDKKWILYTYCTFDREDSFEDWDSFNTIEELKKYLT